MRIIEKANTKEIILDENEELIISTLKGNKRKLIISVKNGAMQIDDVSIKRIEEIKEEEKAIRKMKEYRKFNVRK